MVIALILKSHSTEKQVTSKWWKGTDMKNIDENYAEKLVNAVAKTIVEVFENLTIEDVNMYQIGYNKAIDEFAEKLSQEFIRTDEDGNLYIFAWITDFREIAEQMKGNSNE